MQSISYTLKTVMITNNKGLRITVKIFIFNARTVWGQDKHGGEIFHK